MITAAAADHGGVHDSRRTTCRRCMQRVKRRRQAGGRGLGPRGPGQARRPASSSPSTTRSTSTTGTVKLKAEFANADRRCSRTSSSTRACCSTRVKRRGHSCRARRIQRGSQGTFVYVVKPKYRAQEPGPYVGRQHGERAAGELGPGDGERIAVESGRRRGRARGDRRRGPPARRAPAVQRRAPGAHEPVAPLHPAAGRHLAADGGDPARRASSPTGCCRCPRCPRSTTRRSRS